MPNFKVRTDFIDYPTGWKIQNNCTLEHAPSCSAFWKNVIDVPNLLCDCHAMPTEWARRAILQEPERKTEILETLKGYLPQ